MRKHGLTHANPLPMQQNFFLSHGGSLGIGKRKTARPLDPKRPLHVVLRSSRARGQWSLLARQRRVSALLSEVANKHQVRVLRDVNVGNHLHLCIRFRTRVGAQRFFKEFAGRLALEILRPRRTGARGRFWDRPLFTRVVNFGREIETLGNYFVKNLFQAMGMRQKPERLFACGRSWAELWDVHRTWTSARAPC